MKTYIQKFLKLIIFIAVYYPVIDLSLFYSFVIRATIVLGRLPSYNNPDPGDLKFDKHYNLVMKSSNYLVYCLIIVVLYGVICLIARKNILKINKIHFYMFFGLIIWNVLLIFTDFFEWFID